MRTIIDGNSYDSPYNTTFIKNKEDKVVMVGLKMGDVVGFSDGNHESAGKIIGFHGNYVEIDDASGIETWLELQIDRITDNEYYAILKKIPN